MNKDQAKCIPLTSILEKINCYPLTETETDAMYLSPLRDEKTASFHVNKSKNVWFDHGIGKGGNSVEFACAHLEATGEDYTFSDGLRWISNMTAAPFKSIPQVTNAEKTSAWMILKKEPLNELALTRYLEKRGIRVSYAKKHLSVLHVRHKRNNTKIYALGFKNEEGGYELRNSFFKSSTTPKAITFIRGDKPKPDGIHIFEGFIDYLTYLTIKAGKHDDDVIVLNSVSLVHQALAYMKNYGYTLVSTWMDNNKAGYEATQTIKAFAKTEPNLAHKFMNGVYQSHEDLNAWHMHNLNLKL